MLCRMLPPSAKRSSRKAATPIPRRIGEVRKQLGLSQSALGLALELDQAVAVSRVSQYELGTHTPNHSLIERLSQVTGIPAAYFYTEDDQLASVILGFGKLPASLRGQLAQYLDDLLAEAGISEKQGGLS